MCHGSGCRVTFTNVTFIACTLAVLDGATVTLNNTSSSFDVAQSQGLALFANGTGTKVYMHGSSITGGTQGVTIQVCSFLSVMVRFRRRGKIRVSVA